MTAFLFLYPVKFDRYLCTIGIVVYLRSTCLGPDENLGDRYCGTGGHASHGRRNAGTLGLVRTLILIAEL